MLNLPWFYDYAHLLFWFYFCASFLIVLFVGYTLVGTSSRVEARLPVRETRGFSRAQTGDVMTAVLPMTWSITMLMHASTHSSNFDENTAGTSFTFHVIAYQWGWNYYFPRDVANVCAHVAVNVGRSGTFAGAGGANYAALLASVRAEHALRKTADGTLTHAAGHAVCSHPSALFLGVSPAVSAQIQADGAAALPLLAGSVGRGARPLAAISASRSGAPLLGRRQQLQPVTLNRGISLSQGVYHRHASTLTLQVAGLGVSRAPRWANLQSFMRASQTSPRWATTLAPIKPRLTLQRWLRTPHAATIPSSRQSLRAQSSLALVGNRLTRVHTLCAARDAARQLGLSRAWLARWKAAAPAVNQPNSLPAWVGPTPLQPWRWVCAPNVLSPLMGVRTDVPNGAGGWVGLFAAFSPAFKQVSSLSWVAAPEASRGAAYRASPILALAGSSLPLALGGARAAVLALSDLGYNFGATTEPAHWRLEVGRAGHRRLRLPLEGLLRFVGAAAFQEGMPPRLPQGGALAGSAWALAARFSSLGGGSAPAVVGLSPEGLLTRLQGPRRSLPLLAASPAVQLAKNALGSSCPAVPFTALAPTSSALSSRLVGRRLARWSAAQAVPAWVHRNLTAKETMWFGTVSGVTVPGRLLFESPAAAAIGVGGLTPHPEVTQGGWLMRTFHEHGPNWRVAPEWLGGAAQGRATRFSRVSALEPLQVDAKLEQPPLTEVVSQPLTEWGLRWPWSTLSFGAPLDKFYRAGFARRVASGELWQDAGVAPEGDRSRRLAEYGKRGYTQVGANLGVLRQRRQRLLSSQLAAVPRALDVELRSARTLLAVPTAAPYLDLDPAFIHRRWAFELNASRRGDHAARYRTTWGPLLAAHKLSRLPRASVTYLAAAGVSGPSYAVGLRVTFRQGLGVELASVLQGRAATLPIPVGHGWARSAKILPYSGASGRSRGLWTCAMPRVPHRLEAAAALSRQLGGPNTRAVRVEGPGEGILRAPRLLAARTQLTAEPRASRRLRVSRALCLPSDLPLHGVFGSKDVIHSWALPGLNIKIDCIPGLNNHRRVLARSRGLFWGQCMEVCGRYHHFMPILVRVLHPDVFVLWCMAHVRAVARSTRTGSGGLAVTASKLSPVLSVSAR